mmetsp:Transcript_95261/g.307498  ORF Transcript_95261/g.307498 Transcript_95261/m.307498 type:complete len:527 (-) Transcript_95261:78-1658(-)
MLVYDNAERLRILLQTEGSVICKVIPVGVTVGGCALFLAWWIGHDTARSFFKPVVEHPFAAHSVATAISFAIVYRTSMAWSRYWEAAVESQFMFSKWADSFTQLVSFINTAEKNLAMKEQTTEIKSRLLQLEQIRRNLTHDFSLLSALATHRLTHGDLGRMRRRSEKFGSRGGSWCCCGCWRLCRNWNELLQDRQHLRFEDHTGAFKMPLFRVVEVHGGRSSVVRARVQKSTSGSPFPSCFGVLRTLKGEESAPVQETFETNSPCRDCLALGSTPPGARSRAFSGNSRSGIMRMPSDIHFRTSSNGSPDEEGCFTAPNVTWSSDLVIIEDLTDEEIECLGENLNPDTAYTTMPDRVNIVVEWINEDVNELGPIAETPPPIMSRTYQELSKGMLGFNQATKMADIPFPFPFSQLLEWLLLAFTFTVPLYTAIFTGGLIATPVLAFVVAVAFWSLTEISRELENPFADGPNQLPVIDMHERFVEVLRSVHNMRRPPRTGSREQRCSIWEEPASLSPGAAATEEHCHAV